MMMAMVAGIAVWRFCGDPGDRTPMLQSAYLWQRAWTPAVAAGVARHPAGLSKLIVLAAQVDWDGPIPRVTLVQPDYGVLQKSGLRVGLALRVTSRPAPLESTGPAVAQIATLAGNLVAAGRAAGVEPVEFQVDYDSAEGRLDEYRTWIGVVRQAVAPVPLTITVLPCWLRHPSAVALVRATDGFVVQVHSLTPPRGVETDASLRLVDPYATGIAVRRAAALGAPFEVALPTYGYVAAFDAEGRFLGLNAEGPQPDWPPTAVLREVEPDPALLAGWVRAWTAQRPASMRGVIWYRLPVPGDRHNWAPATLESVMRGRFPEPALAARTVVTDGGRLVDIELVNTGRADARLDRVRIAVVFDPNRMEALDGIGGFIAREALNGMTLIGSSLGMAPSLRPGDRRTVGWVRLREAAAVRVEVGTR